MATKSTTKKPTKKPLSKRAMKKRKQLIIANAIWLTFVVPICLIYSIQFIYYVCIHYF